MTKYKLTYLLFFVGLLLIGCQPETVTERIEVTRVVTDTSGRTVSANSLSLADSGADFDVGSVDGSTDGTGADLSVQPQEEPVVQERLIIRTGSLDMVVTDVDGVLAEISGFANGSGGWVVQSSVQEYSYKQGEVTVRIPAGQFDTIMSEIKALAVEVNQETSSGQDVTEEYVDLSARLANLEATADRVRTFLEDAETVEEALAVNVELSRLEGDIESIKGRVQYLTQSAAFSTISVTLRSDAASRPIDLPGWQPGSTARNAVEVLVEFLQGVVDFLIVFVISILPALLIIGGPVYLVVRWFIKRRRANGRVEDVGDVGDVPAG